MTTIILILFAHFVADFLLQTDKQATNKSHSIYWLTSHIAGYGSGIALFAIIYFGFEVGVLNWIISNVILHWIIDFFTSKINAYLWKKEMRHWFFSMIGFDQFLHFACLLLTFQFFIGIH